MNSKRAKKLRKLVGFHPAEKREYDYGRGRVMKDGTGQIIGGLTDTIKLGKCSRGQYQRVKRSGVGAVLTGVRHG